MLQRQIAEPVDVVGVEVGEEHRFDVCGRKAHERKCLGRALARIEHKEAMPGDHSQARTGALTVGQGRASAAEGSAQAIGQSVQRVHGHAVLDGLAKDRDGDLPAHDVEAACNHSGYNQKADENALQDGPRDA